MNRYQSLGLRLLAVWGVYTALRLLFWMLNGDYTGAPTLQNLWGGLIFDLSAMGFTLLFFTAFSLVPGRLVYTRAWQHWLLLLYLLSTVPFWVVGLGDLEYFKFTGKRSSGDVFGLLATEGGGLHLLPAFLRDYWYLFVAGIAFIALVVIVFRKTRPVMPVQPYTPAQLGLQGIVLVASVAVCVVLGRGGLQLRPLSMPDVSRYGEPRQFPLILNTTFTLLKSVGTAQIQPLPKQPAADDLAAFAPTLHRFTADSALCPGCNVVIVIVESFSKQFIGAEQDSLPSRTPFLDSLLGQSLSFRHSYANGKKSMEAMPSILCGIPAWMDAPLITSQYGNNRFTSLPQLLGERGYSSAFLHGGTNGTMGFESFARYIGTQRYLGMDQYRGEPEDYDGTWGIFDRPFLQFAAAELSAMQQPFFATIFTLSSHHPYALPPGEEGRFADVDPMHSTIRYSDSALRDFFRTAGKQPWFKNTLFVITADHTPASPHPFYNGSFGLWHVPVALFAPGKIPPHRDTTAVISHIDILPTVAQLTGVTDAFYALGKSYSAGDTVSINYLNNRFWMITPHWVLTHTGERTDGLFYHPHDAYLRKDLKDQFTEEAALLERILLARVGRFQTDLSQNRMTYAP